jgi:hypothetical protein
MRKAALKMVFATMIHAAERWCRVSVTDLERHRLKLLRRTRTRSTASNNRTQNPPQGDRRMINRAAVYTTLRT